VVIERLREAMHELRSQGLGYPGPPPQDELPQKPFGMVPSELTYPPIEKELGLRAGFSDKVHYLNKYSHHLKTEPWLVSELDFCPVAKWSGFRAIRKPDPFVQFSNGPRLDRFGMNKIFFY
jgi:hypothetical protein